MMEDGDALDKLIRDQMRAARLDAMGEQYWKALFRPSESLPFSSVIRESERSGITESVTLASIFNQTWVLDSIRYDLSLRASIRGRGRQEATSVMSGEPVKRTGLTDRVPLLGRFMRRRTP